MAKVQKYFSERFKISNIKQAYFKLKWIKIMKELSELTKRGECTLKTQTDGTLSRRLGARNYSGAVLV